MRHLGMAFTLALWAMGLHGATPALAQAANPEVGVPIHATVVSVDRTKGTAVLRYTRPGSQPQTKHAFSLANRNDALRLRRGAVIDGTADMSGKVWLLSNVNVESDRPPRGEVGP